MSFQVRRMEVADAESYRTIRLEALKRHPEAFQATYERSAELTLDAFAKRLERYILFGGFVDGELAGMVGLYPMKNPRIAHKAILWGLYVGDKGRGLGLGAALVEAALGHAREHCKQVLLSVITENQTAIGFFQKQGFECYGTEPRALLIDGKFYDEEFFIKFLD